MVRVLALGPLLLGMACGSVVLRADRGSRWQREGGRGTLVSLRKSVPRFAVGFVVVMAVHSAGWVPQAWMAGLTALDNWLLACAMLAIGLHTRLGDLLRAGRRPLALAGLLFVFLMAAGAALCAVMA